MKHLFYIITILLACPTVQAQQLLYTDFESGIPADYTCVDRDQNEPSRGMKTYGFAVGTAWLAYTEADGNVAAYSGSWYKQAAQADDWMILPALHITSAYTVLAWESKALDADFADGFMVLASRGGLEPADFTDTLCVVGAERAVWTHHEQSLEALVGQDVYLAFVNGSDNKKLLAVDEISVSVPRHAYTLQIESPEAVVPGVGTKVYGYVTNDNYVNLNGFVLTLNYEGEDYTIDHSTSVLTHGDTVRYEFPVTLQVALDETKDYTLSVTARGETDRYPLSLTCFERTVLIEEGTGMWCGYCPRGQYGIELLREAYGDVFVDVAVHFKDSMSVASYVDIIDDFFHDLPNCVMNRDGDHCKGDPYYDIETLYLKARMQGAMAKVAVESRLTDAGEVEVTTGLEFAKALQDMNARISWVLVQDSVADYWQLNSYSGAQVMGGYELLPGMLLPGTYHFKNVARAIYPTAQGEALTDSVARRTPFELTRTFAIPASVTHLDHLKMVAIVADAESGKVMNVAVVPVSGLPASLSERSAASAVAVTRHGDRLVIDWGETTGFASAQIYALDGSRIGGAHRTSTRRTQTLTLPDASGLLIVRTQTADRMQCFKVR